jgi:hypothetical protein
VVKRNQYVKGKIPNFLAFSLPGWFHPYVYRRVSLSAVDIILSKEEYIFGPKILTMETTISFLSEGLAV